MIRRFLIIALCAWQSFAGVIPEELKPQVRACLQDCVAEIGSARTAKLAVMCAENFVGPDLAEPTVRALLAELAGKTDPAAPVVVAPAAVPEQALRSARWDGFPRIRFDAPVVATWPRSTGSNGKTVCGLLRINGQKVEWIGAGRDWVSAHNATVPGGKYYQPLPSGARARITLTDINGRNETNPQELTWP